VSSTVIVTGSEGLIGKSVVTFLESSGYRVIKCDLLLGHDLNNENFVKDFFKKNRGDALVNLFALNDHIDTKSKSTNLFDVSLKSFEEYLRCNLVSLFSVCREYARNNNTGSIVNFSSTYGMVSPQPDLYEKDNPKDIGYAVSKSGVAQLTRYLAVHLAPAMRVNCVVPGGVERDHEQNFKEKYGGKTPLGRMMNVKELNGIVKYLISEESSYTTASVICVDGGWTAW
jgi:NAD(P)-dependent dehydrogenase (short-subunit alcohol dehydrogenase family)